MTSNQIQVLSCAATLHVIMFFCFCLSHPNHGNTRLTESQQNQSVPNQNKLILTKLNQTQPNQAQLNQTKPKTKPNSTI